MHPPPPAAIVHAFGHHLRWALIIMLEHHCKKGHNSSEGPSEIQACSITWSKWCFEKTHKLPHAFIILKMQPSFNIIIFPFLVTRLMLLKDEAVVDVCQTCVCLVVFELQIGVVSIKRLLMATTKCILDTMNRAFKWFDANDARLKRFWDLWLLHCSSSRDIIDGERGG